MCVYICRVPVEPPSRLPPHPTCLGCHRAPVWVPWVFQQIPPGCLFHMWSCMFPCYSLRSLPSLLPCPSPTCTSLFSMSTSPLLPCMWFHQYHLGRFHAAAAKSHQSCATLCDPIDDSPPGSHPWDSPGKNTGVGCHLLLQCMKVKVKLLSHVRLFMTPWTVAYQAPPSMGFSRQEYWSGVPLSSLYICINRQCLYFFSWLYFTLYNKL